MLSGEFERFGVHTCNWNTCRISMPCANRKDGLHRYGHGQRYEAGEGRFPGSEGLFYTRRGTRAKALPEIKADIQKIADELAPCDIVMADITDTTPDDRVRAFLELVNRFNK